MLAARDGRLDWQNCLNRLIAKDASLNVQDKVRRGPRATCESWIRDITIPPTNSHRPLTARVGCGRRRVSAGPEDGNALRGFQRQHFLC